MKRFSSVIAMCVLALTISIAQAGETKSTLPPWAQIGEITVHYKNPDNTEPIFIRFIIHDEWDLLVEFHRPSVVKKLLQLHMPTVSAYYGLTEEELSSPAKNPFLFFDFVLAPVIGPLMKAFPDGPDQLPYSETSFSGIYENKSFQGTVIRTSADGLKYDITLGESGDGRSFRCYGTWSRTKAPPLTDDFSLIGWQFQPGSAAWKKSVQTLGELRKTSNN